MSESIGVELDIEELKAKMRYDCVTFLAFYLGDELTMDVPELHEEIWDELVKMIQTVNAGTWVHHLQKVFCVPRGHAKSTIIKLGMILFLRYSKIKFILYASQVKGIALRACLDVIDWMQSEQEVAVWGKMQQVKHNESDGLFIYIINTPDYGWKRVIIKCLGADQKVRGTLIDNMRPEVILMDDIEDNDTAATDESQAKLDTWMMGNLLKASARKSIRIMLGNMINKRTMLYRLSKDPKWNPTVYGAIIRDKETGKLRPLWPGLWTLKALLDDYNDYRSKGVGHVWVYEMMNMTQDSVFKLSMNNAFMIPRPNPETIREGIICVDPAFGQNAWNDESALTVHIRMDGYVIPFVVDSRKGRWNEDRLLDELLELSYYWNLSTWGIEAEAAQKLLISVFRLKLKDRFIDPDIFLMIPLTSNKASKASRILAFANSIAQGNYGIAEELTELAEALGKYDPQSSKHDDLCDSGAFGLIAWDKAGTQIKDSLRLKQAMSLMQSHEKVENVDQASLVPY